MTDKIENIVETRPEGVDWLEVPIYPENEEQGVYTIRVHLTFFLSNWTCVFGNGCPGLFPVQSSTFVPDGGCCTDSFYVGDREEMAKVDAMMAELTDEDWDRDLRKHVEKHGWKHVKWDHGDSTDEDGDVIEDFSIKGRVHRGACVFQNRSDGSSGHMGCAFHWLAQRTGREHVDTMPSVCWQLPLRYYEVGADNELIWQLSPWDVAQWGMADYRYADRRYFTCFWCVDMPDAYIGKETVWVSMEREIRQTIGDREYDLVDKAIKERIAAGNHYHQMPGAVRNDGRALIPLLIGERTPSRPNPQYAETLEQLKGRTSTNLPHHL